MALRGSPSILFDAVAIISGPAGDEALTENPDAVSFLMDACRHLKAIGLSGVPLLATKAHVMDEPGIVELDSSKNTSTFIDFARSGKVWEREPAVTAPTANRERKK